MSGFYRSRSRVADRLRNSRRSASGFTLIEVGLVIGVLSLVAIVVTNYYANNLSLRNAQWRIEGAVRDVRTIVNASIAWTESNMFGYWPNDLNTINIMQLQEDAYLSVVPPNRYIWCGVDDCGQYVLLGWDRDAPGTPLGDYTDDFMLADDLVVRFHVWGRDAVSIASQLPLGQVNKLAGTDEEYVVEARVTRESVAERFVRLRNEGRELVFAQAEVGGDQVPLGDLQRVSRIARERQPDGPSYDIVTGGRTSGVAIELTRAGVVLIEDAASVNVLDTFDLIAEDLDEVTQDVDMVSQDVDRISHNVRCILDFSDPILVERCVASYTP